MEATDETSTDRSKGCELCTGDDDEILVSVSPRRFSLPQASEKKIKLEIKNKNAFPIFFKVGTSNMDALRPQPNSGRILQHSKITVVVQFYDSAIPIRRHEEVLVSASVKPFEQYSAYDSNVCPYCYKPVRQPKFRHQKKFYQAREYLPEREEYFYSSDNKLPRRGSVKCKDYHGFTESTADSKVLTTQGDSGRFQKDIEAPYLKIKNTLDRTIHQKPELEEICLHALVHRKTSKGCECLNCVDLVTGHKIETKKVEANYVKTGQERRMSDPVLSTTKLDNSSPVVSKVERTDLKESMKDGSKEGKVLSPGKKGRKAEVKDKAREAHVMARVVKTPDATEMSDTETSEMSSRDFKLKKRTKFVSEDEFKKKLAKAKKKKYRMKLEEESKHSTTTEGTEPQKKLKSPRMKLPAKSPTSKKTRKWSIISLDSKCESILRLSWTNFFLLLLLLIAVIVFLAFAFFAITDIKENCDYRNPCFFQQFG